MKIKVYNLEGQESGQMDLSERIFDVPVNEDLIHQVVVSQMANSRVAIADTKDRGEVSGGGKKPWKQKGTGRARHGSSRSPIWKGGGVTFGPTSDRNFSKKVNKKMKAKALFMILTDKLKENKIMVFEKMELEKPSTKKMISFLDKMSVKSKALMALGEKDRNMIKSVNNISNVSTIAGDSVNVVDLMKNDILIVSKEGIKKIEETYKYEF
ncbi:MAG: 50S ribosomal protein L4 [Candidatus Pacebacteria bacterium]|nr:50S ribosomal protein L4 [Candidatus Paceibacterota bacterium]